MNSKITSIFALLAGAGVALGQVSTTPVGYTTQTIKSGVFNLIGLNLHKPTLVSSAFTGVAGADLTDTDINFDTALTGVTTAILEVETGSVAGTVQEFNVWSGDTLTVPAAIANLAIGDHYIIREACSLQEVLTSDVITGSPFPGNADIIWIPDGSGDYTRYFLRTLISPGWYTTPDGTTVGTLVNDPIPINYMDSFLIQRPGSVGDSDLVISGELKTTGTKALVVSGVFNLVGITPPVGLTLFTSGFDTSLTGSPFPANADILWVPDGAGGYTRYFNKTLLAPTGWYTTPDGTTVGSQVTVDIDLPAGVLIQRPGGVGSGQVQINVPSGY